MDYREYRLSIREKAIYGMMYMSVFLLLGKVFYDSFYAAMAGIFLLPFLFRAKARALARRRREALSLEFKDFILALCASLKTGYSAENAFAQAGRDLAYMYGENTHMVSECRRIEKQLQNNKPLEVLLTEFAERSGQDEIRDFAAVFAIAKRSGGNMSSMIQNTAGIISEKIEVNREIQLLYAAKRMEQNIMNVVPAAIIGYVRITTPDYFDRMYHNAFGILIMTVCLAVYGGAFVLSRKIMDIEV